ncbi:MAG: uncharacterized protein KVP18_003585 [Porospora cf. gigantea A]|nr:MAG: hypothetical protein KVP18_003585 [Porospora cf. gigantea A]
MMTRHGLPRSSSDPDSKDYVVNIRRAILNGFFMQVAFAEKGSIYTTMKDNQTVLLHPSSCLNHTPEFVLYNEFVLTSKNYIRTVTAVRGSWLLDHPQFFTLDGSFPESKGKRRLLDIAKDLR